MNGSLDVFMWLRLCKGCFDVIYVGVPVFWYGGLAEFVGRIGLRVSRLRKITNSVHLNLGAALRVSRIHYRYGTC